MKRFLKHFPILLILDVFAVVFIVFSLYLEYSRPKVGRINYDCPTERVFDYADRLSDNEENKLRTLIAEKEAEVHCDIIIVTLETPFQQMAVNYDKTRVLSEREYYNLAMNYADDFYDHCQYGYDEKWGDGIIFVDNFAPELDGWRYYWISTSGACEDRYSSSDIDRLEDAIYEEWLDYSPYDAYVTYVKKVASHMSTGLHSKKKQTGVFILGLLGAVIASLIYMASNMKKKVGKETVTRTTYLDSRYRVLVNRDDLISQNVTKVYVPPSSSSSGGGHSGGGGHHSSGGGHSHGGGGGRH